MSYRAKLRNLPMVIKRLRLRAGFKTQRAAARAVRRKSGGAFNSACLSRWERGQEKPTLETVVAFLDGLGYDLRTLQDELDRADGEVVEQPRPDTPPPAADPGDATVSRRLEELEQRLRSLEGGGSGSDRPCREPQVLLSGNDRPCRGSRLLRSSNDRPS